jgi:hypothetical protein
MRDITTISINESDLVRINALAFTTGKTQIQLMHELTGALETLLKNAIQFNTHISGKASIFYNIHINRTGNKLEIMFVPRNEVHEKKSKPITARFSKEGKFKGCYEE